jgi:hypothetical protein
MLGKGNRIQSTEMGGSHGLRTGRKESIGGAHQRSRYGAARTLVPIISHSAQKNLSLKTWSRLKDASMLQGNGMFRELKWFLCHASIQADAEAEDAGENPEIGA